MSEELKMPRPSDAEIITLLCEAAAYLPVGTDSCYYRESEELEKSIYKAVASLQVAPSAHALLEERYRCGCVRHARWTRCTQHGALEHDEEPRRPKAAPLPASPTPAVTLSCGDWKALLTLIVAHGNGLKNVDGGRTKEEAADWSELYYRLARSIREQTGITDTRACILPPASPTPELNPDTARLEHIEAWLDDFQWVEVGDLAGRHVRMDWFAGDGGAHWFTQARTFREATDQSLHGSGAEAHQLPPAITALRASPTAPPDVREAQREALTKMVNDLTDGRGVTWTVRGADIIRYRDREYPSLPASAEQPT